MIYSSECGVVIVVVVVVRFGVFISRGVGGVSAGVGTEARCWDTQVSITVGGPHCGTTSYCITQQQPYNPLLSSEE